MTAASLRKDVKVSNLFHNLVLRQGSFYFRGKLDTQTFGRKPVKAIARKAPQLPGTRQAPAPSITGKQLNSSSSTCQYGT